VEQSLFKEPNIVEAPSAYSVSEISRHLKSVVETNFNNVRVRGEISGFKFAPSGHVYFNLKDSSAVLKAVCWKGIVSALTFKLADGLEIVASGKISTYEGQSNYQIIIQRIELAGAGALLALLEKRKAQLTAEGLFDVSRKRPIPFFPKVIGVVTSPTGAVIRDILHRIADRMGLHVLVWPVLVQGTEAASQITAAIKGFNNLPEGINKPDVLIIARGGGSVEDLWAFNEEIVVRAAANSSIPLISAVGHETDTTLIDFASDKRAPTPTAAAEMATPVKADIITNLETRERRLKLGLKSVLANYENRLSRTSGALINFSQKLSEIEQNITLIAHKLEQNLIKFTLHKKTQIDKLSCQLSPSLVLSGIRIYESRLSPLQSSLLKNIVNLLLFKHQGVQSLSRLLESFNYKNVLKRGFSLAKDNDGKIIASSGHAKTLPTFNLEFADGAITVSTGEAPKPKRSKPKPPPLNLTLL
jgi:exodeoxyribonuclease VII large subunit